MKLALRSRRWWFLGTAALLLAVVYFALAWYFSPPASAITRENALKIKPGMTLAEVEAILGGPARDESGLDVWSVLPTPPGAHIVFRDENGPYGVVYSVLELNHPTCKEWMSRTGRLVIAFDQAGRTLTSEYQPLQSMEDYYEAAAK